MVSRGRSAFSWFFFIVRLFGNDVWSRRSFTILKIASRQRNIFLFRFRFDFFFPSPVSSSQLQQCVASRASRRIISVASNPRFCSVTRTRPQYACNTCTLLYAYAKVCFYFFFFAFEHILYSLSFLFGCARTIRRLYRPVPAANPPSNLTNDGATTTTASPAAAPVAPQKPSSAADFGFVAAAMLQHDRRDDGQRCHR